MNKKKCVRKNLASQSTDPNRIWISFGPIVFKYDMVYTKKNYKRNKITTMRILEKF